MRYLLITVLALLVSSCTGKERAAEYTEYLKAQTQANSLAMAAQKPLVEIEAQEGKDITGLKSIRVYTTPAPMRIEQQRPNEWAAVAVEGLRTVGTLGGLEIAGNNNVALAKVVGASAGGNISGSYNQDTASTFTDSSNRSTVSTSTVSTENTTTSNTTSATTTTTDASSNDVQWTEYTNSNNQDSTHIPYITQQDGSFTLQ